MTVARDLVRIKLLLLWKPKDNDKINQYLPSIHSDHKVYWKSCYYLWTVCQMGSITVTYLSKTCKMILPGQIFFPVPMRACVISCFSCVRFCESQRTVACQAPLSMRFSGRLGPRLFLPAREPWTSSPRHRIHVSHISCIWRWVLYQECHLGSSSSANQK